MLYDVKPSDTPKSVAQTNNIELSELYKYNPYLSGNAKITSPKIVIPKSKSTNFSFIRYRVKQQETLYSLSKLYNLSIEDLKAFNPQLYDNELKAGEILRIPAYKLPKEYQNVDFNQSLKNSTFDAYKHIVLPRENKSSISSMYGMSTSTFDSLNPGILEVQSGQLVKVRPPKTKDKFSPKDLNLEVEFYEVPPRQTMYSLSKEFGVSEEILYKLNPILRREGLKSKAIIKVPKQVNSLDENTTIVNLENYIQNYNEKKLALFLPFSLQRFEKDSIDKNRIILKDKLLNISLELYEGVNWAIQHAREKGIYTDLKVYDTKRNSRSLDSILNQIDLEDRDAVIGPLLDFNIDVLAKYYKNSQTPIFLPISNYEKSEGFIFNTIPQDNIKAETLITYLDSIVTPEQHLIFITDSTSEATFKKYKYSFPKASFYNVPKTYVEVDVLKNLLNLNKENLVVLETNQLGVTEGVINTLHNFLNFEPENTDEPKTDAQKAFEERFKDVRIRLFTSNQNQNFNNVISNKALCDLQFTVVTASKYNVLETSDLIESYKEKNGTMPSRFVLRAFDLTYDILLRLAFNGTLKDEETLKPITEYNENRFGYKKPFLSNTYYNQGLYIVKYLPDFEFEVINADMP